MLSDDHRTGANFHEAHKTNVRFYRSVICNGFILTQIAYDSN